MRKIGSRVRSQLSAVSCKRTEVRGQGVSLRIIALCIFIAVCQGYCFAHNNIEVDFSSSRVKIWDFYLGDASFKGDFEFSLKKEDGSYIFDIEGSSVSWKNIEFPWVKASLIKTGDSIFVNNISSPDFMISGIINVATNEVFLDVDIKSLEGFPFLKGIIDAQAKVWGKADDLAASGSVSIKDGKYKDRDFSCLSLNFVGKFPLLNLTDSKCILKNGSVYKIEGLFKPGDFNNFFPKARFVSEKVSLAGWELLFDDRENIGLKKNVDQEFSVVFDTSRQDDNFINQGAELRYKVNNDQFLRFRMQNDKTIVGFERRKEF